MFWFFSRVWAIVILNTLFHTDSSCLIQNKGVLYSHSTLYCWVAKRILLNQMWIQKLLLLDFVAAVDSLYNLLTVSGICFSCCFWLLNLSFFFLIHLNPSSKGHFLSLCYWKKSDVRAISINSTPTDSAKKGMHLSNLPTLVWKKHWQNLTCNLDKGSHSLPFPNRGT